MSFIFQRKKKTLCFNGVSTILLLIIYGKVYIDAKRDHTV